tara:strand:+ start:570 stop:1325 length:756 start_codon:yes stop_codon:yes gene_type:complete
MNFNKLLVNKTFLYVVFFLAITNVLGYLFLGDDQAITHFLLIGIITYFFNKNMVVVLLVALLATNFLKVTTISVRKTEEGMENKEDGEMEEEEGEDMEISMDMIKDMQKALEEGMDTETPSGKKTTPALQEPRRMTKNSRMMEKEEYTNNAPASSKKKKNMEKFQNSTKKGGNYVDQAATLENAYDNLDGILGKDGIKKLTNETQYLLSQQKNLAKTMESMAPLVKNAKEMLSGFDLGSLKAMGGINAVSK